MAIGHKMFLNPPPFARVAYEGDLEGLKAIPDLNQTAAGGEQNSQGVSELDAGTASASTSQTVTTQILFGTIPTTVTSSVTNLKKADTGGKGKDVVNEDQLQQD
ncbi:hypothetical protein SOVF_162170 [Spinacia oleracea]|nr:hypothetical protein SOVF_162170 [Spinacia oleracea]